MKVKNAVSAYQTLCNSLDKDNWNYGKDEKVLVVRYNETGRDLTMACLIMIDVKRQVVRFNSNLPIGASRQKMIDVAVACNIVNSKIAYGSFDLDISNGSINYRMTYSFMDCEPGEDFFRTMRCYATTVLDKYNDKFVDLITGRIQATDFADL